MVIQLSNKNIFESESINQITDKELILDGGKIISVTPLELEWILRINGNLVRVNESLSINMKAIVAKEHDGDSCLVTLKNGFSFQLNKDQVELLKTKYESMGLSILVLKDRIADLINKGISKDDCQKL